MAGAQTSEVDMVIKSFLNAFPSVIGYVVLNGDGIPVRHHENVPYPRALMYSALLSDFLSNCKRCLRELLTGPGDSELQHVRLRTREGTEIICTTASEYTIVVIQNCTGKPWVIVDDDGGKGEG
mmetsp:Transcript_25060/g.49031  ORF Transcript_25060/g.49031 Transcript_25060/m.49031 type:complete len:124 (+) Transcript_25060:49-420(+)